jgi:hypothetical protein
MQQIPLLDARDAAGDVVCVIADGPTVRGVMDCRPECLFICGRAVVAAGDELLAPT